MRTPQDLRQPSCYQCWAQVYSGKSRAENRPDNAIQKADLTVTSPAAVSRPPSKTAKVLLADDHPIVRKGLRFMLDKERGIKVVGEASDGREAIKKVRQLHPDIVLMDITMPKLNGLEATRQIKRQFPEVTVLILSMHTGEDYIAQVFRAGALGYLAKQAAPRDLVSAIRTVHRGKPFLSSGGPAKDIKDYVGARGAGFPEDSYDDLTAREREILQLVAEGYSSRLIGKMLHISGKTVDAHRSRLMHKLRLNNVADLARYAIRRGVVDPEEG